MQNSSYLESKVLTAPPQRLHLMLIEGAIRFGRQADEALRRGDEMAAAGPLLRVLDIVGEMLAGVRENKSELTLKIAELYLFMFRRVSEAKINADVAALGEALRLWNSSGKHGSCCARNWVAIRRRRHRPCHICGRLIRPVRVASKAGVSWQA